MNQTHFKLSLHNHHLYYDLAKCILQFSKLAMPPTSVLCITKLNYYFLHNIDANNYHFTFLIILFKCQKYLDLFMLLWLNKDNINDSRIWTNDLRAGAPHIQLSSPLVSGLPIADILFVGASQKLNFVLISVLKKTHFPIVFLLGVGGVSL